MKEDLEHLRLLSIFHCVVAGLSGLAACFPIIHLTIGISMLTGNLADMPTDTDEFPVQLFGLMFTLIPAIFILAGWAFAICLFLAGRYLASYRNHTFCLVMAGISCIFVPFGTVLGVFTILVLSRPSVKELFGTTNPVEAGITQ